MPEYQHINETIGKNIRAARKLSNSSMKDTARALGFSHQQLQKYETGQNRISAFYLIKLSQILQVPVECFFQGLTPQPGNSKISSCNQESIEIAYILQKIKPDLQKQLKSFICSLARTNEKS